MMGFISLVGLVFFTLGLGMLVMRFVKSNAPHWLIGLVVFALGIVMLPMYFLMFYSEAGMSYMVQYPNGTQIAVTQPGYHPKWFGKVTPFQKYVTVAFGNPNTENSQTEDGKSNFKQAIAYIPKQEIRFNDSVTAMVSLTARFQLPEVEADFLKLAVAYRTEENLIKSSLIPAMQEAMRSSARMFSAQEYIGGKGGDFENAVLDQMRGGIYLLQVTEEKNKAIEGSKEILNAEGRSIQQDETVQVKVSIRRDASGMELRKDSGDNPIQKFKITLVQANVQDVDPDPSFKEKLKEQRDAAAQVAIERQNTKKEDERKLHIIAKGEAEKAEVTAQFEKIQVEKVTEADTKAQVAAKEQNERITKANTAKQEADIEKERKLVELEIAKLEAERILTLSEAEAKGSKLRMDADGALEKRLNAYIEVSRVYAEALKNSTLVPSVVIQGSDKGSSTNALDLISLLTANAALDLGIKINEGPAKPGN